jgi:two-component system LytT family response regulator
LKAVIVDDEPLARRRLRDLLKHFPDVTIAAEASNAREAGQAIVREHPEVLFLDVEMPGGDGFEVLEDTGDEAPIVIFTTAYEQYALRAFDAGVGDYLLKPFTRERLGRALERVRKLMNGERLPTDDFQKNGGRLVFRAQGKTVFLQANEILYAEAQLNYLRLFTANGAYVLRGTIQELSERLADNGFVRVHRSYLINLNELRELEPCNNGEFIAILRSGAQVPVGRAYRQVVKKISGD